MRLSITTIRKALNPSIVALIGMAVIRQTKQCLGFFIGVCEMTKDVAKRVMNWDGIDKEDKGKLLYFGSQFRKSADSMMSSYLEAASMVAQAHEILSKPGCKGKFAEYVEIEMGVTRQTAYNMVAVDRKFGGSNCKTVLQFTPSAMIELSSSKLPDDVIEKAKEIASGGKVTGSIARKVKGDLLGPVDVTVTNTDIEESAIEESDEQPDISAPNDDQTEYEDVDPPEPATTAKPAKPKEQQLKELAALGSKYVDILMRTLDDMQGLKKSDRHESGLKSCRELKKFFGTW